MRRSICGGLLNNSFALSEPLLQKGALHGYGRCHRITLMLFCLVSSWVLCKFVTRCITDDYDAAAVFTDAAVQRAHTAPTNEKIATFAEASFAQPTLNIGVIGNAAHGKSTLCEALTGTKLPQSVEHKRQFGYPNCRICRCTSSNCTPPGCFTSTSGEGNSKTPLCHTCSKGTVVVKSLSFLDCPGSVEDMGTMISGVSSFDAILIIAAVDVPCPSAQVAAQIAAITASECDVAGRIAIVQTKIEKKSIHTRDKHAYAASHALRGTIAEAAPIFHVCATEGIGLDVVRMWLARLPDRPTDTIRKPMQLHALRSFNINRKASDVANLKGGLIAGSLTRGVVNIGSMVEIRPGLVKRTEEGRFIVQPLRARVEGIKSGVTDLHHSIPGGLIALQTSLCPSLCAKDKLAGAVVGQPGTLPPVWDLLYLEELATVILEDDTVSKLHARDEVRVHACSAAVQGTVVKIATGEGQLEASLHYPLCVARSSLVLISKKNVNGAWTIVARARVVDGQQSLEPKQMLEPVKFYDVASETEVFMEHRRNEQIGPLLDKYCDANHVQKVRVRFEVGDQVVNDTDTLMQLKQDYGWSDNIIYVRRLT